MRARLPLIPFRPSLTASLLAAALALACGGKGDKGDSPSDGHGDGDGDAATGDGDGSGATSGDGDATTGGATGDGDGDGDTSSGGTSPAEPPNWEVTGIATWRGDARGAYTIFHDDTCNESVDNQFDQADPALVERGLVASFGAIAENCEDRDLWDELDTLISHGHEVANHSFSHPNLTDPEADIDQEIDTAHSLLSNSLTDYEVTYFIFPYDSFNDSLIEHLRDLGYIGARAGERGLNIASFPDDLRINFDVYGPGYSIYVGEEGTPCAGVEGGDGWNSTPETCRAYVMNQYVDDIIDAGGYGIRELHSLDGQAWEPLPLTEYEAHLDYVVEKIEAGDLWMATASDAIRYRRGRDACVDVVVSADTLLFSDVSAECERYSTPLSYFIRPLGGESPTSLTASQSGAPVPVIAQGDGTFLVDADPSKGPVTLTTD